MMLSTVFYVNQSLKNQITILYYVYYYVYYACSFLAQIGSILTLMHKKLFLIIVLIDENIYLNELMTKNNFKCSCIVLWNMIFIDQ